MQSPDLQRIKHICAYCSGIEKTIQRYGESFSTFQSDRDYQNSIAFSILQIGELVGGLSLEFRRATSNRMQWGAIKGTRNVVVHNYGKVDKSILWDIATNDIPGLKQFCEEQLERFRQPQTLDALCADAKARAAAANAKQPPAHETPNREHD